jgi:hypothetical protein
VLPDRDAFSLAPCSLYQGRCAPALPVPTASLDCRCARRSARGQVGTTGCRLRSNKAMLILM